MTGKGKRSQKIQRLHIRNTAQHGGYEFSKISAKIIKRPGNKSAWGLVQVLPYLTKITRRLWVPVNRASPANSLKNDFSFS
jgi:hypothetical protein